jgi:hypothetical protein
MKYKLTTLFLLLFSFCFAQKTNEDLEHKINLIETKYLKNIDSLQKELLFFKMKDDHYTTALEVQAGHYEHTTFWGITIASIILTLAGLIGFGWFWSDYAKLKKQIVDLEDKLQKDFETQKDETIKNIAIANATAAVLFEDKGMVIEAYDFYLKSIEAYINLDNFVEVNEGLQRCLTLVINFIPTEEDLKRNSWFLNKSDFFLSHLVGNEDIDISNKAFELLKMHKDKFSVPITFAERK